MTTDSSDDPLHPANDPAQQEAMRRIASLCNPNDQLAPLQFASGIAPETIATFERARLTANADGTLNIELIGRVRDAETLWAAIDILINRLEPRP
jgi:hypothetical protein